MRTKALAITFILSLVLAPIAVSGFLGYQDVNIVWTLLGIYFPFAFVYIKNNKNWGVK